MKIKLLDLFSGIGGFHLGLERAGFEIEAYNSEVDKYAVDVYANNFKTSKYVGSVTDVRGSDLPKIDAITFGSPCQDFSLAGKRKGMGGNRSSLVSEAIRLIDECRPSFFIWENVKGTFSTNNGADFWAIIQAFTNIGGYRLEWQLLNTKWFLPQNRERIYLVGYIGNGSGREVFPLPENNRSADGLRKEKVEISNASPREFGFKDYCPALLSRDYKDPKIVRIKHQLDAQEIKVKSGTKKGYEIAGEGDSINYSVPSSKTRRGRVGKGVAQTLDTGCQIAVIGDFRYDEGYRERSDGDSPTLSRKAGDIIVDRIRRLTPKECERLQGFPDDWTRYGKNGEISDSQRYKMCGNAVTVDVVEAVGRKIIKAI